MSTKTIMNLGGKMSAIVRESILVWQGQGMTVKVWREEESLGADFDYAELTSLMHDLPVEHDVDALRLATHILSIDRVSRVEILNKSARGEQVGVSLYKG